METNPTTEPTPLADAEAEAEAHREAGTTFSVYLSPRCIASFDGGPATWEDVVEHFTLTEDDDFLIATSDWNGKEFIVEI